MHHPDQIRHIVETTPLRSCVIEGDRALTFREVDERADRAADAWLAAGLTPGDRVAVLALNEAEYLEWQVAAQRAGLVLVPLNARFHVRELQTIIDDTKPRLLIHGSAFDQVVRELKAPMVWHLGDRGVGDSYNDALRAARPVRREIDDPDALTTLLYTSGTTGSARGAMITNRILLARSLALSRALQLGPEDIYLQALPMFHLAQTVSCAFAMVGATNVMLRKFEPVDALAAMKRHNVTHTFLVPTMIRKVIDIPGLEPALLSTLRALLYGGSSISPSELKRALLSFRCDFYQVYGMTETGVATVLPPAGHDPARPEMLSSAGSEIATVDVEIVDEQGRSCPPGDCGEIVISGASVMTGYWNANAESETALRGGRMHSGDVGYRDAVGLLHVTDRIKDLIITGGENVSATEVEHVLLSHPLVAECAVVGVPDDHYVERVHAVVVAADGRRIDPGTFDRYCVQKLARYKRPRSYSQRNALPVNATGKIDKTVLRRELLSATRSDARSTDIAALKTTTSSPPAALA